MTRKKRIFGALLVILPLLASLSPAGAEKSPSEIRSMWLKLKPLYLGTPFALEPRLSDPHLAGELRAEMLNDGVNMVSFVRYLADLPYDMELDEGLNTSAGQGAVLLALHGGLSHSPPKPNGMSDSFYAAARSAVGTANLYYLSSNVRTQDTLSDAVKSYMSDSDLINISHVGHRRWILNPPLRKIGFGMAQHYQNGNFYSYSCMQILDESRSEDYNYDFISWPARGAHPLELFNDGDAWSVSLNPEIYDMGRSADIRVTVTNPDSGEVFSMGAESDSLEGNYFKVSTQNIGVPFCVIFRPLTRYRTGDTFEVELEGVYKKGASAPSKLNYTTTFFNLEGSDGPRITPAPSLLTQLFLQFLSIFS